MLKGIVSDQPTISNICDVYNVWSGLQSLRTNVSKYCPQETRQSVLDRIDSYIQEYGAEAITVSYEKMSGYKRADGGFSSSTKSGITKMFGVIPIGTGVLESNVDAIGKPTWGMVAPMFSLLKLSFVPMYTRHHFMLYLEMLLEDDAMKAYFLPPVEVLTFDEMPSTNYLSVRTSSADITIEDIGDENSALKINKNRNSSQTVIDFSLMKQTETVTGVTFETDVMISDVTKSDLIAFSFGPAKAGHNNRAYRFAMQYRAENGSKITLREEQWTEGTNFKAIDTVETDAVVGSWFKLKIVYEVIGSPEIRVYINGELIHTTHNVYSAVIEPYISNATLSVIMFTPVKCTLWLDNTSLKQNP